MVTRSGDSSYGPSVLLIDRDEKVGTLDGWLAVVAKSEPVDLGVPAAALLDEERNLDEA
jgi:hypothetical protein